MSNIVTTTFKKIGKQVKEITTVKPEPTNTTTIQSADVLKKAEQVARMAEKLLEERKTAPVQKPEAPKNLKYQIDPKDMDLTMAELNKKYGRQFMTMGEQPTVNTVSAENSITTPATAQITPIQGQWYRLVNEGYYIMYRDNHCYFVREDDLVPSFLVSATNLSFVGGLSNKHISLGRFADILTMKPDLNGLLKVYKTSPVSSDNMVNNDYFKLENATPVWSKK